jgi:carboxymethylenebutenolidase
VSNPEKLEIRTPDGVTQAWTYADAAKPSPAILFFPDAGGVRQSMLDMASRLASLGYFVMVPNTLYRGGDFKPVDMKTVFGDPAERARLMAIIKLVDNAAAMRDVGAYLDALAGQKGALPGKVGCIGYCMGGRIAFTSAGAFPDRFGAAASIHGGQLVTGEPDSPHLKADRIMAKLYLGVADNDGSCTPEHQGTLASLLGAAHVDYQIELYAGAMHGFAVPDMAVYSEAAAERHWERIASFFAGALPRPSARS